MNKLFLLLLPGIFLCNVPDTLAADQGQPAQIRQIEALQRRAKNLSFDALDINNYHLAKARTWLDLATSEAYDNDNSGITEAAIGQAEALLNALENKQADIAQQGIPPGVATGIPMDTPLQLTGSEAVRPDFLDKIAALKKHEKFSCGQRQIAEAEVYLVWSGHEFYETGQSHADSYMRNVENLIHDAQTAIDNCTAAPVPHVMEKITLSGDALFAFDKATLNPSALSRLDGLADNIKTMSTLEEIVLVGHTDRMTSIRHPEHNQALSEQRAETIRQYLIGKGIPAEIIHASGAGSTQPIVQCSTKLRHDQQIACLQPNRRVEIILRGGKSVDKNKDYIK